jgi:protoporphyrinogen oxidase
MNALPSNADIVPMAQALKEGLLIGGSDARIGIPVKPFKKFFIEPSHQYLIDHQVQVMTETSARQIVADESNRILGVETASGFMPATAVVAAIPPEELLHLLPQSIADNSFFSRLGRFEHAGIATIHLTFDRPVLQVSFGAFHNGFAQWVFRRGDPEEGGCSRVSVIISNAPDRTAISTDELTAKVVQDLRKYLPFAKDAEIKAIKVIRTVKATVVLKPGSNETRPGARTPIKGFYLAGDWCATGLPATIESAARSGIMTSEEALIEMQQKFQTV